MIEVPIYDIKGAKVDTLSIDEAAFGGEVNAALLKQAIVAYHTNSHQGSAATKSRGMVSGSTRKLFRQKGTGNARRGSLRANIMRGGGVTFAKKPNRVRHRMTKACRRKALDSAILAKLLGADMVIVDGLKFDAPKTKPMVALLTKIDVTRGCVLALADRDDVVYRSSRNIPRVDVRTVAELNAFDVVRRNKMVVTREAIDSLLEGRK